MRSYENYENYEFGQALGIDPESERGGRLMAPERN